MKNPPDEGNKTPTASGLDFPIAPVWFSLPPDGTLDDGIRLSLLALEQIKDRSELWNEREKFRCLAEFRF